MQLEAPRAALRPHLHTVHFIVSGTHTTGDHKGEPEREVQTFGLPPRRLASSLPACQLDQHTALSATLPNKGATSLECFVVRQAVLQA